MNKMSNISKGWPEFVMYKYLINCLESEIGTFFKCCMCVTFIKG